MRTFRSILTGALAVVLVALMMGLPACGGEDGVVTHPPPRPGEGPSVPDATVAAFKACAERGQRRLKESSYVFQFDVEVTESGQVGRVRLKDSYPTDSGIDSCLARALEDMQVPPSAERRLLLQTESVSPQSRGLIGNPLALLAVAAVELIPAMVVAAGVTVVVAVTVSVGADVIETISKRDRKAKCMGPYYECLANPWQPEKNRATYGDRKDCRSCLSECTEQTKDGIWPDYKCPRSSRVSGGMKRYAVSQ
jgi:hypothetical protein